MLCISMYISRHPRPAPAALTPGLAPPACLRRCCPRACPWHSTCVPPGALAPLPYLDAWVAAVHEHVHQLAVLAAHLVGVHHLVAPTNLKHVLGWKKGCKAQARTPLVSCTAPMHLQTALGAEKQVDTVISSLSKLHALKQPPEQAGESRSKLEPLLSYRTCPFPSAQAWVLSCKCCGHAYFPIA